ncbi:MAG: hypothetical protein RR359_02795 [Bacilli bacterium]
MGYQESLNKFKRVNSLQSCIDFLEFIGKDYFDECGFKPMAICRVNEHIFDSNDRGDISKGSWVIYFVGERGYQRTITQDLHDKFDGSEFKKVIKDNGHRMIYIEDYIHQCDRNENGEYIEKMVYYPIIDWTDNKIKVETPRMRKLREKYGDKAKGFKDYE